MYKHDVESNSNTETQQKIDEPLGLVEYFWQKINSHPQIEALWPTIQQSRDWALNYNIIFKKKIACIPNHSSWFAIWETGSQEQNINVQIPLVRRRQQKSMEKTCHCSSST
jgi:hypothetical protein